MSACEKNHDVRKDASAAENSLRTRSGRSGEPANCLHIALEPPGGISRQSGAQHGMVFHRLRGRSRHFGRIAAVHKLQSQRTADAVGRQQGDAGRIAGRPQQTPRAGGAVCATGFGGPHDAHGQLRLFLQDLHTGEDMVHLPEKGVHEAFALSFIKAELFQKDPDALAGKPLVEGMQITQGLMALRR